MEERSVVHDTVVVCRRHDASAERMYRAWADAAKLERCYVPGDEKWTAKIPLSGQQERRVLMRRDITKSCGSWSA